MIGGAVYYRATAATLVFMPRRADISVRTRYRRGGGALRSGLPSGVRVAGTIKRRIERILIPFSIVTEKLLHSNCNDMTSSSRWS
jgi:hypothetical protein